MTTTEIAVAHDGPLAEKVEFARMLAGASLLPKAYQRQPANVLLAQQYAEALDLPLMTVIQTVHVIEGKPTASAQLIGALVRRAGHRLRVTGDDTHAVAEIVRCDDPQFPFRSEWTLDRARAAGLAGKGTWKAYPGAMLKARAITEAARDACPEALFGVAYTPEELGAPVDADGIPLAAATTVTVTVEQPDADGRDWHAALAAVTSVDEARALWRQAKDAGALTPELSQAINDRVHWLGSPEAAPVPAEVIDVDPETGEVIPAELWEGEQ